MLLVVVYACVAVAQTRATAVELHERLLWHANRKEFIDVPNPCAAFSSSKKWIVSDVVALNIHLTQFGHRDSVLSLVVSTR